MATAAQLANLLGTQADLNYYTMQLNYWSAKYDANSQKLNEQVKYEQKWESAYETAIDTDKDISASHCGKTIKIKAGQGNEHDADIYADLKVYKYDESLSLELAELDIEYDTMKTMYEALVTELQAQKESEKQSTATSAQNTGLLQS